MPKGKIINVFVYCAIFALGVLSFYYFERAYEKEQSKVLTLVAEEYFDKKEYEMATMILNQAVGKHTGNYIPYYLLGVVYLRVGNDYLALMMLREAINIIDKNKDGAHKYDQEIIIKMIEDLEMRSSKSSRSSKEFKGHPS